MNTSKNKPTNVKKQPPSIRKSGKSAGKSMPKSAGKLSLSPKKPSKTKASVKKGAIPKKSASKSAVQTADNKTIAVRAVSAKNPQKKPSKQAPSKAGSPAKVPKSVPSESVSKKLVPQLKQKNALAPKGKVASNIASPKSTVAKAGLKNASLAPKQAAIKQVTAKPVKRTLVAATGEKLKTVLNKPITVSKKQADATIELPKVTPKKPSEPIPPPSDTKPEIVAKIRLAQSEKELRKDLAQPPAKTSLSPLTQVPKIEKGKDRMILMVRDPYWLHAHWDITRQSVDRAKASLAENWHTVKPILRLLKMDDSGTTSNAESIDRDIEIHGGVRNWYIEVNSPPSRFRMLMGYLTANNRFYELARSNTVITPVPGGKEASDDHWADIATDAEHIYSMSGGYCDDTQTGDLTEVFEERLKRTMDADVLSQFGSGAEGSLKRHKHFHFDVDAELIVFGSTHPEAHVSVGVEPVKVRTDGTFSIRMPLPDRRQVLPATAKSRDGVDEQTVVIAVERNTKVMEPLSLDSDDL
ncbi:MAG: DUF4912 domain-containing protein [Planctomycetota bacterium]|nr:DUF4912 domain-containing protein [Planctomycetota bacterium]